MAASELTLTVRLADTEPFCRLVEAAQTVPRRHGHQTSPELDELRAALIELASLAVRGAEVRG